MNANIPIDSMNSLAFNSVNRITSTIKSTFQKGNSLIRSEIYNQKLSTKNQSNSPQKCHESLPTYHQINPPHIYQKLKPFAKNNQKVKTNIINILNFAQIKWREFCTITNKSAHQYSEYLQKFKKIDFKLNTNLQYLIDKDSKEQIQLIKLQFKQIIEFLNQRARKYIDKNKQIINLIKKKDKEQFQEECQQEAMKQEMLELLGQLRGQTINMGSDLKKDNVVISQIHEKQERQLDNLKAKSKGLKDMINSPKLGWLKLISYAGVGIIVWIFTLLFILIF